MTSFLTACAMLTATCAALCCAAVQAQQQGPMLAHNVYFSLDDNSEAARQALVEDCHKYLAPTPGIVFYAAGTLSDLDRDVNDRDYDVALHVVFENRAALDHYAAAPKHMEFIEKHKANWKKVRVFDSLVSGAK